MKTATELREEAERQKRIGDVMAALNYAAETHPIHPRPNMAGNEWERRIRYNQQIAKEAFKEGTKYGFESGKAEGFESRQGEVDALTKSLHDLGTEYAKLKEKYDDWRNDTNS